MRRHFKGFIGLVLFLWILVVLYFIRDADNTKDSGNEINRALRDLDECKKKNDELHNLLAQQKEEHLNSDLETKRKLNQCLSSIETLYPQNRVIKEEQLSMEPSKNEEVLIKQVYDDAKELEFTIVKQLSSLEPKFSKKVLQMLKEQTMSMRLDVEDLSAIKNPWRQREADKLHKLVEERIKHIQHPTSCSSSKRLVCKLNKGCGFGCQIHHLLYCFLISYGTRRTLIIDSERWRYSKEGWDSVFLPVSETCTSVSGATVEPWRGEESSSNSLVVSLPIVDGLPNRPPYMPLAIPDELYDRLLRLHGNPPVWWIGQFIRYLWRPQPWLKQELMETEAKIDFKSPIVGIQVRRTDKVGTEAALHDIDEYMKHVDDWYHVYETRLMKEQRKIPESHVRRVYLATDDSSVLPEAREKYPNYLFFGDTTISESAQLKSRYTKSSLVGVIKDIELLSNCDYIVCTFSSQVCRLAYELMQTLHPDAATRFHSLDDIYYFGGQTAHEQVARLKHDPLTTDEIELRVGDVVGIAGNHWDGFSRGTNRRTGKNGLYPSYKTVERYPRVHYPTYAEARMT